MKSRFLAQVLHSLHGKGYARRAARSIGKALERFADAAEREALLLSKRLDETRPCPNCGKSVTLSELGRLKTYCYDCSYWGMDPNEPDDGSNEESEER